MPKDGTATKELILDCTQELVYERGFSATTLDLVLEKAKLTKGAFFHHFKSKDDLATSLIERYLIGEAMLLNSLVERAEQVTRDPLQQVLAMIGFLIDDIDIGGPLSKGCLFASYAFELAEFDENVRALSKQGFTKWREVIGDKFEKAMEKYQPKIPVSAMDLTENMLASFEGGIVIFRMEGSPHIISHSMIAFRNYVTLLFEAD